MILNETFDANDIKNITLEQAVKDFENLKKKRFIEISNETRIGNAFLNYFTFKARLNTRGVKGMNFFEFLENKEYHNKPYIKRLIDSQKNGSRTAILYRVYTLHCGNISLLKPVNALKVIDIFKPNCVLDFCCGWGSSLVGASALNINKFIGIDLNPQLITPLSEMRHQLKLLSKTEIELYFTDCLLVDYSLLDYDMVFTSPPYYNTEKYVGSSFKTIEEWDKWYIQIFSKTYKYLKPNGYFLLNIPEEIYNRVCVSLLGNCVFKIELLRKKRKLTKNQTNIKTEYIYVFFK